MHRLKPDQLAESMAWASLPELPAMSMPQNLSPQLQAREDMQVRRSLTGTHQQLSVGFSSPNLQRKSAPNLLVGHASPHASPHAAPRSPRLNRVADTQFNPLAAPSQSIPLPVPSFGTLQSLSVPSSPLTSRSEGMLHQQAYVGGQGYAAGNVPSLTDLDAHLRLMPAVTPPRERSRSMQVGATALSPSSPQASRRNTAADRADMRRLSDKIADQKRRQQEQERQMAEILGRSPPASERTPSVVLGEARAPSPSPSRNQSQSSDPVMYNLAAQQSGLGMQQPPLGATQSLGNMNYLQSHHPQHVEPSLDWSDFAQLSLGLSLRDLNASPNAQLTSPSHLRSSEFILPQLELPQDDPNNMLLMEASGGLPLELSADEIEKQLEAILAGRAL